jgi:hypothetical protein
MITLIGPNWRSKLALQERLTQFPGNLRVCWGASNIPNALNGGDRLDGLEQLQAFTSTGIECPSATEDISTAINWVFLDGSLSTLKEGTLLVQPTKAGSDVTIGLRLWTPSLKNGVSMSLKDGVLHVG